MDAVVSFFTGQWVRQTDLVVSLRKTQLGAVNIRWIRIFSVEKVGITYHRANWEHSLYVTVKVAYKGSLPLDPVTQIQTSFFMWQLQQREIANVARARLHTLVSAVRISMTGLWQDSSRIVLPTFLRNQASAERCFQQCCTRCCMRLVGQMMPSLTFGITARVTQGRIA